MVIWRALFRRRGGERDEMSLLFTMREINSRHVERLLIRLSKQVFGFAWLSFVLLPFIPTTARHHAPVLFKCHFKGRLGGHGFGLRINDNAIRPIRLYAPQRVQLM